MSTLTQDDIQRLMKYDTEAQRSLAAKNLTGVHRYLEPAGNILRSATDHDSMWFSWKAQFMAHHEAAGRLAEEIEQRRQHWQQQQQQRRDIETRGRHQQGAKQMADPTTMRMARQMGCKACVFAKLMKSAATAPHRTSSVTSTRRAPARPPGRRATWTTSVAAGWLPRPTR